MADRYLKNEVNPNELPMFDEDSISKEEERRIAESMKESMIMINDFFRDQKRGVDRDTLIEKYGVLGLGFSKTQEREKNIERNEFER